ncbi:MAG: TonB-dependent receptor [Vicingus serpentipes]|nr:TonB-dependent receptor [Vicingus serpentipes]
MRFIFITILLFYTATVFSQIATIQVLDETKQAIPSVHILIKETQKLIVSDANGIATIPFENQTQLTLEISFLGFIKKTQPIKPNDNLKIELQEDIVTLNSFVVTGQYAENSPEKAVQKITIIDHKKIEKMAAVNLKDVLTNEMNVRLTQDNILGSGMSLQGMSGENVKILIDGVPVVGRLNGNVDLSQINLNDIEHIEVIEGPMSVNYGTNALAGVINLITKTNKSKKLNVIANSYNENIGQYNLDGSVSISNRNHMLSFSGGRNYFDGWKDGDAVFGEKQRIADSTRYKSWKPKEQFFGKASYNYQLIGGNIKYTLGYFDEKISNRGLPRNPYGETAFDDYYYTTRLDNSLIINKKFKNDKNIKATIAYNDYQRIKNTFFKDLTTLEETQTENAGDQDTTKFNQWVIRSSFSTSKDSVKVNYEVGTDINIEEAFGVRIENKTQQMGDYAAYASIEYRPFNNTIIRPGVRYAYNTNYQAPVTPSINLKQTLGKFNIRASYARGFRAPSLKELYFDFVDINHNIVGNTDLKAEQSNNFNLSINYTKVIKNYVLKVELSSFYNQIENLITLAQNNGTLYSYVNIGDYQTHGVQLNNNISFNHLKFGIGGSYIGRYNHLSETKSIEKFSYTPELKSSINYEFPKPQLFVAFFYKFTGKLPGFGLAANDEIIQTSIDAYHTADLSIGKQFWKKRIQVTLGSKNLFDVKAVNSVVQGSAHSGSSGSSPVAMGRTYFLKMTFNLSYDKNN